MLTIVLLLGVLTMLLTGVWLGRRRSESLAWDRELTAAFGSGKQEQMSRPRGL